MKSFLYIGLVLIIFTAFGGAISTVIEGAKAGIGNMINGRELAIPNNISSKESGPVTLSQPDGTIYKHNSFNHITLLDGREIEIVVHSCDKAYTEEWLQTAFPVGTRVHVRKSPTGELKILRAHDHLDMAAAASKASTGIC